MRPEFGRGQQVDAGEETPGEEGLRKTLAKVQQTMSRLLDAYTEGYVDRAEFPERMERLQQRRDQLQTDLKRRRESTRKEEDLRLAFSRIQDFADEVRKGSQQATWHTRRAILRALVKRVEVGDDTLDIVYRVPQRPFAEAPTRGQLQHCCGRQAISMPHKTQNNATLPICIPHQQGHPAVAEFIRSFVSS